MSSKPHWLEVSPEHIAPLLAAQGQLDAPHVYAIGAHSYMVDAREFEAWRSARDREGQR